MAVSDIGNGLRACLNHLVFVLAEWNESTTVEEDSTSFPMGLLH
jgi:hypothetical protein